MPETNQPSEELSEKALQRGYWIATHRNLIRKLYSIFWIALASISMLIFLLTLVNWLTHIQETRRIEAGLATDTVRFSAIRKPSDITFPRAQAVRRDVSSVDVVAQLKNPNDIWAATSVVYEVFVGGNSAGTEEVTLAPLQEKFITKMNIPNSSVARPAVQVTIHSVTWKKMVDQSSLPEVEWNFFDAQLLSVDSQEKDIPVRTTLAAQLQNKSVYGFRQPQVVVLLLDDADIVQGIGSIYVDQITSLETRTISFSWPERLSTSLQIEFHVNVDELTEDRIIRSL